MKTISNILDSLIKITKPKQPLVVFFFILAFGHFTVAQAITDVNSFSVQTQPGKEFFLIVDVTTSWPTEYNFTYSYDIQDDSIFSVFYYKYLDIAPATSEDRTDTISIGFLEECVYHVDLKAAIIKFNNDTTGYNTFTKTLDFCTQGIFQEDLDKEITIYPNPTNHEINFQINSESNKIGIEIFDVSGRCIENYSFTKSNTNGFNGKIDISNFNPGIYIFKFKTQDFETTRKLIKK